MKTTLRFRITSVGVARTNKTNHTVKGAREEKHLFPAGGSENLYSLYENYSGGEDGCYKVVPQ